MKRIKAYTLTLFLLPFLAFIGVLGYNLSLDPDHIFFKGGEYPFIAKGQRYYKIAGIINNYEVKNAVIGSSLMNNTLSSEVEAAMGWKDVYLFTKDAADVARMYAITDHALRRHKIENLVYALEPDRMTRPSQDDDPMKSNARSFIFLYDDNPFNDLEVFAQLPARYKRAAEDSKKQRAELERSLGTTDDAELLRASKDLHTNYMTEYYRGFNRPLFISSLSQAAGPAVEMTEEHRRNLVDNYARYIKPFVEEHPETQFHFIIPPSGYFSKRPFRYLHDYAARYLVDKLLKYPNVKIYAFTNDAFNADLRLYRDYDHFHIEVTRFMIRSLAKGDHRLTAENVDAYMDAYKKILENYKVPEKWAAEYSGDIRGLYPMRGGNYPRKGYITYRDAAKLVWGDQYSEKLYDSIPRSPYLAEARYVDPALTKTWPPLDASRKLLEKPD